MNGQPLTTSDGYSFLAIAATDIHPQILGRFINLLLNNSFYRNQELENVNKQKYVSEITETGRYPPLPAISIFSSSTFRKEARF